MTDPATITLDAALTAQLRAELWRLRGIERAAWQAYNLAKAGRALDSYATLAEALEPRHTRSPA